MATASDNISTANRVMGEGLTCNICLNLLREPKDLECPHVFCLECLQTWVNKKPTIECPECRYITIVPQGGLDNLKTNLRLKNLVENYIKSENTKDTEKQTGARMCPYHAGERQHFFCVTCGITVCHNCLVLKHPRPQHEIKELKEVTKVRMTRRRRETIDDIERNLKAAKQQAEREVTARVQEIVSEAEAQGEEMIRRIQTTYQQRMKLLQQEKQNQSNEDRIRIDKLCIEQDDMQPEDIATLQFKPGLQSLNSLWFGELVTSNRERTLSFVSEFGRFRKATGVAVTQTGLLAVVDRDNDVSIYCNYNGDYKRQFCLKTVSPVAATITSEGKFLISEEGWIKVFSPAGRYERSWPRSVYASEITTTPDDMIVIGNYIKGVITVHQSSGELIRTHQANCNNIQDIASNGKQIAFTTCTAVREGKVCVIDFITGLTLWTVDVAIPLGICYEQKSNTLFVTKGITKEKGKNRGHFEIAQFCSTTGHLISRLASGLYNPLAMTVTHDNKLLVADVKTVKIFSIQ